jgi:hypothetical protein
LVEHAACLATSFSPDEDAATDYKSEEKQRAKYRANDNTSNGTTTQPATTT